MSICTLWIGNVDPDITETDIYNAFFVYGPVVNIHMAKQSKCAFVEMGSRAVAEYALQQLYGALIVQGRVLSLHWARPRSLMDADAASRDLSVVSGYILPPPVVWNILILRMMHWRASSTMASAFIPI